MGKDNNIISEKRCVLCNKPYNYKYKMFGRVCLNNLYGLLGFSKPSKFIWNKELYLCTKVAWKNHKFFLNKNKKYLLLQKYIALQYLNKMNCVFLDDIKESILNDINSISAFSNSSADTISFTLNNIYKLYNYVQEFNKYIEEFQDIDWEYLDEKNAEKFMRNLKFIFNTNKEIDPLSYAVFYSMQYTFWKVIVIGGILKEKKLSAMLLNNSLAALGKEPDDLVIQEKLTDKLLLESGVFNDKIKELIKKYGNETGKFNLNDYEDSGIPLKFEGGDLLYSLHRATMYVNGIKNEDDSWNIDGEINDTYDFTEFKNLKEYVDNKNDVFTDFFSTLLNNFGVISYEYGVIKKYNVKIKFNFSNYKIK